ncbi:MAG: hypothetical protein HDS45_02405 [Bacteroides sp.]|nr:hypothetical protein [Bacteroides sp.]
MRINLGSLMFNATTATRGGTPSWGTEMGQGEGYKFSFDEANGVLTSMVYTSVPNPHARVYCPLGKGGNQSSDYEFVLASLYDKIFVNGMNVPNAKFLLLIIKKLVGQFHVGRRTLKYNPRLTLDGINYNSQCFERMAHTLGISQNGAWFVSEIRMINQDELHFTAHIIDKSHPVTFEDSNDRIGTLEDLAGY